MPPEAVVGHRQPAELGDDVLAAGDVGDVALPVLEDLVASIGVASDADRRAEVVEDHQRVGNRAREREELAVLVVVVPRVVGEAARAEPRDAGAERGILEEPVGRAAGDHEAVGRLGARDSASRIPRKSPPPASMCASRIVVEVRQPQIGVPDDAADQPAAALAPRAATHSVSPTGANSAGPSARYAAWHSMNTVRSTRCPLPTSASRSARSYGRGPRGHR